MDHQNYSAGDQTRGRPEGEPGGMNLRRTLVELWIKRTHNPCASNHHRNEKTHNFDGFIATMRSAKGIVGSESYGRASIIREPAKAMKKSV